MSSPARFSLKFFLRYISTAPTLSPTTAASHHQRRLSSSIIPHLKNSPLCRPSATFFLSGPLNITGYAAATVKSYATNIRLAFPTCSNCGERVCLPTELKRYRDKKPPEVKFQYPFDCRLCGDHFISCYDKTKHKSMCRYQFGKGPSNKMDEITYGEHYLEWREKTPWNSTTSLENERRRFRYFVKRIKQGRVLGSGKNKAERGTKNAGRASGKIKAEGGTTNAGRAKEEVGTEAADAGREEIKPKEEVGTEAADAGRE